MTMRAAPMSDLAGSAGASDGAAPDHAAVFLAIGLVVLIAWCGAVATGLGRALLGPSASQLALFLAYLPGVMLGSGLIGYGAVRRVARSAPRWVPRESPPPLPAPEVRESERDGEAVSPRRRLPREAPSELAIVHLGPAADPAWAAWGLRWEAPGHGSGLVPLPAGARVLLGRDPSADVVVRLDQVSWHHLELDVQEARVIAFDCGSSNGTRTSADEALGERRPWPWEPGGVLLLASPVALTLTLEPLR